MQKGQAYNPTLIRDLAVCSEIAKTFGQVHDGEKFYVKILNETLTLAQRYRARAYQQQNHVDENEAVVEGLLPEDAENAVLLPEPRLHSLLLHFHGLALALGRIPDTEIVLERFAGLQLTTPKLRTQGGLSYIQ